MYNVFTDFHHSGLLQSLILLFEKRLKGNVYRPIGMEWADNGFWNVYDHPATRQQYLSYSQKFIPLDGSRPLNQIENIEKGIYYCHDIDSEQENKAISLETFKSLPIDFVIASLPQHIAPFKRLIKLYKPNAKLIYQIGNAWNVTEPVDYVMASALVNIPAGTKAIVYHQEFDTEVFNYRQPVPNNHITSFVNCFSTDQLFKEDYQTFLAVEKFMPDWTLRTLGGGCRDGVAHGSKGVADEMGDSRFIWHTKKGGDGYGHVIHNAFAMGRPPIVKMSQYKNKLAGQLMTDGETCIDIDGLSANQVVEKIKYHDEESRYNRLSINAYKRFTEVVNFEREAKEIKKFLSYQ